MEDKILNEFNKRVLSDIQKVVCTTNTDKTIDELILADDYKNENINIIKYEIRFHNDIDTYLKTLRVAIFRDILHLFKTRTFNIRGRDNNAYINLKTNIDDGASLSYYNLIQAIDYLRRMRYPYSEYQYRCRFYGKKTLVISEKNKDLALDIKAGKYVHYDDINILPDTLEILALPDECFQDNLDMWFVVVDPTIWDGVRCYLTKNPVYIEDNNLVFKCREEVLNCYGVFCNTL